MKSADCFDRKVFRRCVRVGCDATFCLPPDAIGVTGTTRGGQAEQHDDHGCELHVAVNEAHGRSKMMQARAENLGKEIGSFTAPVAEILDLDLVVVKCAN